MFHYDDGLFLTQAKLAVDVRRRQPRAFVSHAHMDHLARHMMTWATPATKRLIELRLGARHRVIETPFGKPFMSGDTRLVPLPAGHCLGSAMLLAEQEGQRLLYTGDFRLRPSITAEPAEPPQADILIMESTFGQPRYRFPERRETELALLELIQRALDSGQTPVIHAYALGKSQEVTAVLARAGIPVQQHPEIYATSRVYEGLGVDLGELSQYAGRALPGHVVMTLPRGQRSWRLGGIDRVVSFALTGWAMDGGTRHRLGVDHALPFSDHADFDELLELVDRVAPRVVYCTHGPQSFVQELASRGIDARPLAPPRQRVLPGF